MMKKFYVRILHIAKIKSKSIALVFTFFAFLGLTTEKSFASSYSVTTVTVSAAQTGTLTYGTAGSVTYTITLTENGNGNPSANTTFSLNWVTTPGGVTFTPTTAQTLTGNGQTITLTVNSTSTTPAGNYSFTVTSSNGAKTSGSVSFVVGKKALTITTNDVSKVYGTTLTGAAGSTAFTSSGLVGAETIGSVTIAYGTGAAVNAAVGSYANQVTPSAATGGTFTASNYTISYVAGKITVTPKALTITANDVSKVYGTTLTGGTGSTAFTSSGLVGAETIGSITIAYGTGSAAADAVGPYSNQVTPSAATGGTFTASNYTISYVSGKITVTKAVLTVTANNQAKVYGTANPALTVSYSGFAGSDNAASLITQPTASTTATNTSPAGSYIITPSGGVSSNYTFSYVNGTLSVTKADVTVAISSDNNPACAGTNVTFSATISTIPPGVTGTVQFFDGATSLGTSPISGDAGSLSTSALSAGSHLISATYSGDANYNSATSASITETINSLPQGSFTANGPFCSTGTGQLTWTATAGVGPYTIIYNDGTANRTQNNVTSGVAFNVFTNPFTSTTTYTLVSVTDNNGCVRSSGFTGSSATITVYSLPTITADPQSQIICPTFPVSFSVSATGDGLTYQWYHNGNPVTNGSNISGATASTLNISQAQAADAGSYYVIVSGNSPCASATSATATLTVDQQIFITSQPTASQTLCVGSPFTISVTASGTILSYQWFKGGVFYQNAVYDAINGTYSLTIPSIAVGDAGSYQLVLDDQTGLGCSIAKSNPAVLIVNPIPDAVATPSSQTSCSASAITTIAFTGSIPATTYNWTRDTPAGVTGIATSGSGNITGTLTNTTSDPVTVTFTITPTANGCTGTPITATITVNPTATITAVSNQTVCNNASTTAVNFTSPTTGGTIVYNWTNNTPSIGLTASGAGTIASFTATNAGSAPVTATITVTPSYTNGGATCTGTPSTFTITVNPPATVTTISNQTICNNASTTPVNFTSPTTGGTIVYNWTNNTPSIGLAASGTGNIASFTATNPGNAPVTATITVTPSYTNGTTCAGTPSTFTITVNPTATVTAVSNQTYCNGATAAATSLSGPVSGTTFTWTNSNTAIGLAASGSGNIPTLTAANGTTAPITATITITPTANGCTGTTSTYTIIVNPKATVTAVSNQTICNNGSTTAGNFSSPTTGGTIIYNWTNNTPSIGLPASGSGNIASFTASNAGSSPVTATITVTPSYTNNSTCAGTPSTFTITVNPTTAITAQPSATAQAVCLNGAATSLSVTATGVGLTYQWYSNAANSNSGGTLLSGATSSTYTPVTTTAGTLYYYVIVSGTCTSVTSAVSGAVTISPVSTVGSLTIDGKPPSTNITSVCPSPNSAQIDLSGSTGTVTWQSSTDGGTTWTTAAGTATQTTLAVSNLSQTTIYRAAVTSGPCSVVYSNIAVVQVIPAYAPTNPKATPPIICLGQSSTLTADTGYPPTGIPSSSGQFQNGASDDKTWTVYNNGSIDGNALNAGGDNGNDTYWRETVGNNYLGYQSPNPKFAITHGTFNTILESPIFNLIAQPSASLTFIQSFNLKANDSAKIEISTDGGLTYHALIPPYIGPLVFGGPTNFPSMNIDLSAYIGLSNLRVRFNFRGHSGNGVWALDGLSTPGAALPINYSWAGTILNATTGVPVIATPQVTGISTYTLTTTIGGCPGGSVNVNVMVNPLPTLGGISQVAVCSGDSATISLTGLRPNTTSSVIYNIAGGASVMVNNIVSDGSGNASFKVLLTSANNGQTLTITSITGSNSNGISCGATPNVNTVLKVNPLPTATIAGTTSICQGGTSPNITLTGAVGTAPYTFTYSINGVTQPTVTGNPASISVPTTTAGTFTYSLISVKDASSTGCSNLQSGTATVTINPQATITIPPANQLACPEGIISFTVNATSVPAPSYNWDVSTDNGATWNPVSGADYTGQTTNTLNVLNITAGNTKDGYLYRSNVVASAACPVTSGSAKLIIHNIWHGYTNTDWNTTSNWSDGAIPTLTCDSVIILNVPNKPILSTGANGYTNHLVIRSGATVTVTGNTLHIAAGIWDDNGALNSTAGMIDLNGNVDFVHGGTRPAQIISGKMFYTPYLNNSGRIQDLQISNPKGATVAAPTVNDTLNITGSLGFGSVSNVILNTNNNITLVSDASGTARVTDITNNGANSGNNFNGWVEVERYINVGQGAGQHAKAWEFLSTPTRGQTVKQSWMENGTFASTGYGTRITSPFGTGAGFDASSPFPSMKYYKPGASPNDPSSTDWQGISNTGDQIYDSSGYMLFVRGDRSIPGPFTPPNNTRLRTKGNLLTYTVTTPLDITNVFTSVGNPYASAIDMRTVMAESAANPFFYVWQSPTYGTFGYGAYVVYSKDIPSGNYISTPGGVINNNIQSGQAFLVQNVGTSGNMVFNEHSKAGGSSFAIFAPQGISSMPAQLRTNLYRVNTDGITSIADGTLSQYNDAYSNQLDGLDARKFYNSTENLSIRSGGKDLVIEGRQPITQADTIFFRFTNENMQHYRFDFIAQNLSSNGAQGYMVDNYLHTITPLNMDGITQYNFSIENVNGSKDPGRFFIVFKSDVNTVLPVTITSLKANPVNNQVKVDWNVTNEKDMKQYEVERSKDGVQFTKVATSLAVNTGTANYSWLDINVLPGYYYYRIRCINKDGKIQYTGIVKVLIGNSNPSITIYPNPITNGVINLHLDNLPGGKYGIRLMNQLGQVIVNKKIERTDGSSIESIQWNYNLSHGIYRLEVTQPNGRVKEIKVMY